MGNILAILIVGIVLFELIEHILFPLVWAFVARNRKSPCGVDGIPGKLVEVKDWRDGRGQVLLEGELWNAVCSAPLRPGDTAVVQKVDGLVLTVTPAKKQTRWSTGGHSS